MSMPQEKLSTADMVSAGQAPAPEETREERPTNVRHIERAAPAESAQRAGDGAPERPAALLPGEEASDLRGRWDTIQTGFVDEPRRAVQDADNLVAQTMKRVAEIFARERETLEQQWSEGHNVSTEDLRIAMKRYRSFFDRLLSV
jgi:hypothetical protein